MELSELFELGGVPGFGLRVRDDEEGVDDTGDPEEKAQEDVEEELDQAAGEEDGERREDEGDEVSHGGTLANIRASGYYSLRLGGQWVDKFDTLDKCGCSIEHGFW